MSTDEFLLAEKIKKAYKQLRFVGAIIYGCQGVGKSTYALKIAYKVLQNWEDALNICFFDIRDVIKFLEEVTRYPVVILDDAGVWLSKYIFFRDVHYSDYVTSLFHLIRTKVAGVLFTTPDPTQLLKSLRSMEIYYVKIVEKNETESVAKIYRQKVLPTGYRYTKLIRQEIFTVRLPDDVYEKYVQKRAKYTNFVLKLLEKQIKIFEEIE